MLLADGYRIAMYTSPHLLRYNERVRIDGVEASDAALCDAFAAVEDARAGTLLTYFEFGTLGALWLFARQKLDALILEVGLGGRLDAVNIVDPDVAVVTTVAIDHVDYLGAAGDIGREKPAFSAPPAGDLRDRNPPVSLIAHAAAIGATLLRIGRDYGYTAQSAQWDYWGPGGRGMACLIPAARQLSAANASTALCAADALRNRVPLSMGACARAGRNRMARPLPGPSGRPVTVLDVAQSAGGAYVCRQSWRDGVSSADDRRFRHHVGQGHRCGDRAADPARRSLGGRDASTAARFERRSIETSPARCWCRARRRA
jgi:dihydrofolate synthase/folylpolyglutamate synthase